MDSETFDSTEIYQMFSVEFGGADLFWREFIKNKDLGIEHVVKNLYRVKCRKKWMLAKIKYGF